MLRKFSVVALLMRVYTHVATQWCGTNMATKCWERVPSPSLPLRPQDVLVVHIPLLAQPWVVNSFSGVPEQSPRPEPWLTMGGMDLSQGPNLPTYRKAVNVVSFLIAVHSKLTRDPVMVYEVLTHAAVKRDTLYERENIAAGFIVLFPLRPDRFLQDIPDGSTAIREFQILAANILLLHHNIKCQVELVTTSAGTIAGTDITTPSNVPSGASASIVAAIKKPAMYPFSAGHVRSVEDLLVLRTLALCRQEDLPHVTLATMLDGSDPNLFESLTMDRVDLGKVSRLYTRDFAPAIQADIEAIFFSGFSDGIYTIRQSRSCYAGIGDNDPDFGLERRRFPRFLDHTIDQPNTLPFVIQQVVEFSIRVLGKYVRRALAEPNMTYEKLHTFVLWWRNYLSSMTLHRVPGVVHAITDVHNNFLQLEAELPTKASAHELFSTMEAGVHPLERYLRLITMHMTSSGLVHNATSLATLATAMLLALKTDRDTCLVLLTGPPGGGKTVATRCISELFKNRTEIGAMTPSSLTAPNSTTVLIGDNRLTVGNMTGMVVTSQDLPLGNATNGKESDVATGLQHTLLGICTDGVASKSRGFVDPKTNLLGTSADAVYTRPLLVVTANGVVSPALDSRAVKAHVTAMDPDLLKVAAAASCVTRPTEQKESDATYVLRHFIAFTQIQVGMVTRFFGYPPEDLLGILLCRLPSKVQMRQLNHLKMLVDMLSEYAVTSIVHKFGRDLNVLTEYAGQYRVNHTKLVALMAGFVPGPDVIIPAVSMSMKQSSNPAPPLIAEIARGYADVNYASKPTNGERVSIQYNEQEYYSTGFSQNSFAEQVQGKLARQLAAGVVKNGLEDMYHNGLLEVIRVDNKMEVCLRRDVHDTTMTTRERDFVDCVCAYVTECNSACQEICGQAAFPVYVDPCTNEEYYALTNTIIRKLTSPDDVHMPLPAVDLSGSARQKAQSRLMHAYCEIAQRLFTRQKNYLVDMIEALVHSPKFMKVATTQAGAAMYGLVEVLDEEWETNPNAKLGAQLMHYFTEMAQGETPIFYAVKTRSLTPQSKTQLKWVEYMHNSGVPSLFSDVLVMENTGCERMDWPTNTSVVVQTSSVGQFTPRVVPFPVHLHDGRHHQAEISNSHVKYLAARGQVRIFRDTITEDIARLTIVNIAVECYGQERTPIVTGVYERALEKWDVDVLATLSSSNQWAYNLAHALVHVMGDCPFPFLMEFLDHESTPLWEKYRAATYPNSANTMLKTVCAF